MALRAVVATNAAVFAADLTPILADIRASGRTSLRAVATELSARGIRTRRGSRWGVGNVKGLLLRSDNSRTDEVLGPAYAAALAE